MQFAKVLPTSPDSRKSFVQLGGLKKIQHMTVEEGSKLQEYVPPSILTFSHISSSSAFFLMSLRMGIRESHGLVWNMFAVHVPVLHVTGTFEPSMRVTRWRWCNITRPGMDLMMYPHCDFAVHGDRRAC
jgi:hypothetical protein